MNRTLTAIALTMLTTVQMMAQNAPSLPPPQQQLASEIVRVQHERAEAIYKLLFPMVPAGTRVAFDNGLRTITLSGPPEVVEMLVKNIARLDEAPPPAPPPPPPPPSRSIELTVQLLLGSQEAEQKVPDDLSGVVKQLRTLFPFKGFQLLDSTIHRSINGQGGMTTGVIPSASGDQPPTYTIQYKVARISSDEARRQISIDDFDFRSHYPIKSTLNGQPSVQYGDAMLRSDISIREGQRIVIGKSTLGPGRESLFVVLSAKVID